MSRQPFPDELQRAEDAIRALGSTVTLGVQPSDRYLSGELWTIHTRDDGKLGMGQGGTLSAAFDDLHTVAAPTRESAR